MSKKGWGDEDNELARMSQITVFETVILFEFHSRKGIRVFGTVIF
jgi:hypothetical protein